MVFWIGGSLIAAVILKGMLESLIIISDPGDEQEDEHMFI